MKFKRQKKSTIFELNKELQSFYNLLGFV